jgi:hypothetical protein
MGGIFEESEAVRDFEEVAASSAPGGILVRENCTEGALAISALADRRTTGGWITRAG